MTALFETCKEATGGAMAVYNSGVLDNSRQINDGPLGGASKR